MYNLEISEFYFVLNYQDKYFANDTNSSSGNLLPSDMNQGDKIYKDRKEHKEKYRAYRKYSELTPPTLHSYDNYGLVNSQTIFIIN